MDRAPVRVERRDERRGADVEEEHRDREREDREPEDEAADGADARPVLDDDEIGDDEKKRERERVLVHVADREALGREAARDERHRVRDPTDDRRRDAQAPRGDATEGEEVEREEHAREVREERDVERVVRDAGPGLRGGVEHQATGSRSRSTRSANSPSKSSVRCTANPPIRRTDPPPAGTASTYTRRREP